MSLATEFLSTSIRRVRYYKDLAERCFEQLADDDFYYKPNDVSNSIAVIIQHVSGNMLSRWTDFLTSDGEKEWRNRDAEFGQLRHSRAELMMMWQQGWDCYLQALESLKEEDLLKTITIRQEPLSVIDAINRQLAHYPYHVGQIVYIGRMIKDQQWKSLSIAPGASQAYNEQEGVKDPAKRF